MIKYALTCEQGHAFESWFASSAAYDKQVKNALVSCPVCNSTKDEKAIMAPRLAERESASAKPPRFPPPQARQPRRRRPLLKAPHRYRPGSRPSSQPRRLP